MPEIPRYISDLPALTPSRYSTSAETNDYTIHKGLDGYLANQIVANSLQVKIMRDAPVDRETFATIGSVMEWQRLHNGEVYSLMRNRTLASVALFMSTPEIVQPASTQLIFREYFRIGHDRATDFMNASLLDLEAHHDVATGIWTETGLRSSEEHDIFAAVGFEAISQTRTHETLLRPGIKQRIATKQTRRVWNPADSAQ
jgi:hypothetical protein